MSFPFFHPYRLYVQPLLLGCFLVLGSLAFVGCNSSSPSEKETTESPPKSETATSPPSAAVQEVSFKTSDGWTIIGDLYSPTKKSVGAVILLHQRNGSAKDWKSLCTALQEAGITALAIDQRGAGRSTQGPGPTGDDAPWPTSEDTTAAIASLKTTRPIGLAGASYGANNALIYAAAHSNKIKGVALFSPGANYNGLDALAPAQSYKGSLTIYHDKSDSIAGDGPEKINTSTVSTDHALHLSDGSKHGTDLLTTEVIQDAVQYFQRILK